MLMIEKLGSYYYKDAEIRTYHVPAIRARREAEELENYHDAEIIPFPLNF